MFPSTADDPIPAIADNSEAAGFVRCSKRHSRYFEKGDGTPFVPIGLNICFPRFFSSTADGVATMHGWLDRLAENEGNYARIFLGHPFFDIESAGMGNFDERKAGCLDAILDHAWALGIRLKLTIELFRSIEATAQAETFPGALNFSRPLYHVNQGGMFGNMEEFLNSDAGKLHFLGKLDWLSARYQAHPGIFGWDLWNEMNAVGGEGWQRWTEEMLPELKARFPNHLAMQNLGSYDREASRAAYEGIMPLEANDVAQVHRYLDLGAAWEVCHGAVDIMMADAVSNLRRIAPGKPVLLSEGGAVEPNHARPWDHYHRDKNGAILHDILFSAFFAGAAGSGNAWHWHEYVDRNNLWWQFKRFARAIEGIDPVSEEFAPCRHDTGRLRVYVLRGRNVCLAWCRDARSTWKTELMENLRPEIIRDAVIAPPPGWEQDRAVSFYDPWTDQSRCGIVSAEGTISLPPFRRSMVVRF